MKDDATNVEENSPRPKSHTPAVQRRQLESRGGKKRNSRGDLLASADGKAVKRIHREYPRPNGRDGRKNSMAKQTDDQDIFALLEQIEQRKQPAIEALKAEIDERIGKLTRLGVTYRLVEGSTSPATAKKQPKAASSAPKLTVGPSANYNEKKHCPTCHENGHDGRAHRTHKEKFTNDELKALGLLPPEIAA